jgi:hypothetical protein
MRFSIALLAITTGLLTAPLFSAPMNVPDAPAVTDFRGDGEVVGSNIFAQTFEVKRHDGLVEIVPFSKWTDFFKLSAEAKAAPRLAIDPTEVQLGDRVRVLLDSNGATALSIVVMPRPKVRDLTGTVSRRE